MRTIAIIACLVILSACFSLKLFSRVLGVVFGLVAVCCFADACSIVLHGHELIFPAIPHGQSPVPPMLWFALFLALAVGLFFIVPRRLRKKS
jgi:hypothetical protein